MTLRQLLKLWAPQAPETWGAVGALNFFILLPPPKAAANGHRRCPKRGAEGALNVVPKAPLPRRAREIPPKAGVREYIEMELCVMLYIKQNLDCNNNFPIN